jgi:hypothetical protein
MPEVARPVSPLENRRDSSQVLVFKILVTRDREPRNSKTGLLSGAQNVGRLLEVPGVFSQGETLDELRENIQDAYELMVADQR